MHARTYVRSQTDADNVGVNNTRAYLRACDARSTKAYNVRGNAARYRLSFKCAYTLVRVCTDAATRSIDVCIYAHACVVASMNFASVRSRPTTYVLYIRACLDATQCAAMVSLCAYIERWMRNRTMDLGFATLFFGCST